MEIIPLAEKHLEDAALLVSHRYQRLCDQVAHLPERYVEVTAWVPLLQKIFAAVGTGVAAIQGSRLVGFLTGWQMPSFRGKRSIYSPEWANGTEVENSANIYEEMYSRLAATWVADKYIAHYISLFPNDFAALRAWHWLGFGMISVDGLRKLEPIRDEETSVDIRRARPQDIELVIRLREALRQYMKGSPVFLLTEKKNRSYYEEWLGNPEKVTWLAFLKDEPVAFMMLGPADQDVCTIIVDEQTTSIYAAFTQEKARSKGVATALLDHALMAARASGYERCAVSFEPMNLLATRFWLKYFDPVCFSIVRHVDDRII
jgi:GNAT superfamily N-acetyltransferase